MFHHVIRWNVQNLGYVSHNVIVTQVNGSDRTHEFQKLPDLPGCDRTINGVDGIASSFIEQLRCDHLSHTLP